MRIKIDCQIDNELEIIIRCSKINEEVNRIISLLKDDEFLIGKLKGRTYQIKIEDIFYLEVSDNHLFAYCQNEVYEVNSRLYELEEMLQRKGFVRISKANLLNINKLDSIKALLNGRYEAKLINNERIIINRHYVNDFKKEFGM